MKLMINARRDGYGTDQVGQTMNVGELIEYLEQFDDETPVYLQYDGGFTYGRITPNRIEEFEDDDDELKDALEVLKGRKRGIHPINDLSNNESGGHDTVLKALQFIMNDELFSDYMCHADWFYHMSEDEKCHYADYEEFVIECDSYNRKVIDRAIALAEEKLK